MDYLDKLNTAQKSAVTAGEGPVLVLAGPGSGKTRVLTQRIAYLIGYEGIRPYQMLVVTFTNKAAREMEQRLINLLGEEMTRGLMLGTFHSICARILRRESERLPVSADFVIFDADDQQGVVKTAIKELNLDDKTYRPVAVHAAISRAKNELLGPDEFPVVTYRDEAVKRIYKRYQSLLQESNGVDFDDLLLMTTNLLANNPDICEKYGQRFHHVLVDEFQDTNIAQYNLINYLSSIHHNVFCVGDPDQSVYRWRGADYRNVIRFEEDHPGCQTILLEQNYRSRQTILDAAMAVIDRNPRRKRKNLFSDRGDGEKIVFFEGSDDYAEAGFVVDTIAQLVATRQYEAGDCAVMYRTNSMSRLLEEAFLQARLPYRLVGAQRFYGRREVKDMIAYLRLVQNKTDDISLTRIINLPPRGLGEKAILALRSAAQTAQKSVGDVLLDLARGQDSPFYTLFPNRAVQSLVEFGKLLANWQSIAPTSTIAELFDQIATDIRFQNYLDDDTEEGKERWENVLELHRLADEYDDGRRTLSEFLENLALVSDQDTIKEGNVPTLLTLHAAKGLEFGVVFIVGLDDGILPHSRSFDEPEEMEEERRLFYVGITRAKDRLYILRAQRRGGRGLTEDMIESRFLGDIPMKLVSGNSRSGKTKDSYGRNKADWVLPSPPRSAQGSSSPVGQRAEAATGLPPSRMPDAPKIVEQKYRDGMHIKHSTWGDGIVLKSQIQDNDEIVDIVFPSVGIKRLLASLAKLTIEK